ncbi:protein translocase subunit SecD, partial [Candidatus Roizmanbacteria bacterium]|nr:protein translocase subunit SecD [Candidatus Roizmanbacteria bacterium]
MKFIRQFLIVLIASIILWIDLPEKTKVFGLTLNSPQINWNFFGLSIQRDFKTKLGLDLKGGSHLVFEADTSRLRKSDLDEAVNSAKDIIEKRVNFFGVSEPVVQTSKSGSNYRVIVDLPGITNISEAVERIGRTAQLSFREQATVSAELATKEAGLIAFSTESTLTGKHVRKASVTFDSNTGKPQVALSFSSEGVKIFAELTKKNVGKPIAIFVDEFLISAPVVQQEITDGNAVITGQFTTKEAKQLAQDINAGALPLPIKLVEQRNIGPTLGKVEVERSVFAGAVGLVAVGLFMILYYRKLGIIATIALLIYGFITFAIFKSIPVVLTLSGIAGFLLSIGMAVDSNILIFERIKEEQREGRDFETAKRLGFGRALDAIKDANFTTILVALILFNPLNWNFLP